MLKVFCAVLKTAPFSVNCSIMKPWKTLHCLVYFGVKFVMEQYWGPLRQNTNTPRLTLSQYKTQYASIDIKFYFNIHSIWVQWCLVGWQGSCSNSIPDPSGPKVSPITWLAVNLLLLVTAGAGVQPLVAGGAGETALVPSLEQSLNANNES